MPGIEMMTRLDQFDIANTSGSGMHSKKTIWDKYAWPGSERVVTYKNAYFIQNNYNKSRSGLL